MGDPVLELVKGLRAELQEALVTAKAEGASAPVAKIALRSLKAAAAAAPGAGSWACAEGCSFCCHNAVAVSAPEAFRLGRWLESLEAPERAALSAHLLERAAQVAGLSLAEQARRRTPCALLSPAGACRAHAARPLPCIGLVSYDRGACERVFRSERERAKIPVDRALFTIAGAHNLALRLACRRQGLAHRRYELHDALRVVLTVPDAEARFLAGEDPFAGCRLDPSAAGPGAEAELDALEALTE